jgi:hypothetical protein
MSLPPINEEHKVQQPAIEWLKNNWGYEEIMSAEEDEAWGAPIDSVGLMDGRTLLIEVKVSICGGSVRHLSNRPSSIESKISRTLVGVFNGDRRYNLPAIRQIWDRKHPLGFVLLAKDFTQGGFEEAKDVLKRRSSEWRFDYGIWQWTGQEVRKLAEEQLTPSPRAEEYTRLHIPLLVGKSTRSRAPSLAEHREEAGRRGLLDIFDFTVRHAGELAHKISTTGSGITLVAKGKSRKRESSIGVFVRKSSKRNGMNFGFMSERSDIQWNELPGRPAPKVGAYSGPYRYIHTLEDIDIALRMLAPSP